MQAPVELILKVLVSSMNSAPDTSVPLRKTGTCRRMRGERRVDGISTIFLRRSVSKCSLYLSTKALVRIRASVTMRGRENFYHYTLGTEGSLMAGRIAMPRMSEENRAVLPLGFVRGLLDTIEKTLVVAERSGDLLVVNTRARQFLESQGYATIQGLNLFKYLLQVDSRQIFGEIEKVDDEVELPTH